MCVYLYTHTHAKERRDENKSEQVKSLSLTSKGPQASTLCPLASCLSHGSRRGIIWPEGERNNNNNNPLYRQFMGNTNSKAN